MSQSASGFGRSGFVERNGLGAPDRAAAVAGVLDRVDAEGIETVRICFVDQHGLLRGKTLPVEALVAAFADGVAMTSTLLLKDTAHRTVFPVWQKDAGLGAGVLTGAGDFIMVPDPESFRPLPWSPHSAWLLSDIHHPDGTPIAFDSRAILQEQLDRLAGRNMAFVAGLEVEFFVYAVTDPKLTHADGGMPATPPETAPLSHGYQYLTEDRYDQLEGVMDQIRRGAVALGLPVRSMEIEFGPSQFEFTFAPMQGLGNADTMVLFRAAVKQICRRAGLHATFMSRPRVENGMASGWHLHQSVIDRQTGRNLFAPEGAAPLSPTGLNWLAGLLRHARACCLLSTPTVNGYKRYQPFALAPDRVQWGLDNKGAMLRVIAGPGDGASRIENRVGEPAANPYLYFASQIASGIDGIEGNLSPTAPSENPYSDDAARLPGNLGEAITEFSESGLMRQVFPDGFADYLTAIKRAEWNRYLSAVSEWEQAEYFSTF